MNATRQIIINQCTLQNPSEHMHESILKYTNRIADVLEEEIEKKTVSAIFFGTIGSPSKLILNKVLLVVKRRGLQF